MTTKAKASLSSVSMTDGDIVLDCTFRGTRCVNGQHIALIQLPDNSVQQAWSDTAPTLKRGELVDARYYKGKSDIVFSLYSY
jgi:hypothetical protein